MSGDYSTPRQTRIVTSTTPWFFILSVPTPTCSRALSYSTALLVYLPYNYLLLIDHPFLILSCNCPFHFNSILMMLFFTNQLFTSILILHWSLISFTINFVCCWWYYWTPFVSLIDVQPGWYIVKIQSYIFMSYFVRNNHLVFVFPFLMFSQCACSCPFT